MSGLDEKAIAIAEAAYMAAPEGEDGLRVFLRAYLAATTPADVGEEPVAWRWKTPAEDDHWVWSYSAVIDNPHDARCEPLYSATALERVVRERDELRRGIAGKPGLERLSHGQYLEMTHTLHAAVDGGRTRAESAEAKLAEARKVIEPFAEASREFNFAMGPDGIDDGITVIASTVVRDREATLSTSDFSAARRFLEETK